jgi:formylglycine-generating enzyme required for sulfatase activity
MTGNVLEWVRDRYVELFYAMSPERDPVAEEGPPSRVFRGGSWGMSRLLDLGACRLYGTADWRRADLGFRVARSYR